jgi:hypothetical protein
MFENVIHKMMVGRGNGCEIKGHEKALELTEVCFESSLCVLAGLMRS